MPGCSESRRATRSDLSTPGGKHHVVWDTIMASHNRHVDDLKAHWRRGPGPLGVALSSRTQVQFESPWAGFPRATKRKLSFARKRGRPHFCNLRNGTANRAPVSQCNRSSCRAVSDEAGTPHGHLDPAAPLVMSRSHHHTYRQPEPSGSKHTSDPVPVWSTNCHGMPWHSDIDRKACFPGDHRPPRCGEASRHRIR